MVEDRLLPRENHIRRSHEQRRTQIANAGTETFRLRIPVRGRVDGQFVMDLFCARRVPGNRPSGGFHFFRGYLTGQGDFSLARFHLNVKCGYAL